MAAGFQSLAGWLLVSHPLQRDENFCESVVLIFSHEKGEGAVGAIINRPFGRLLGEAQPKFAATPLAGIPLQLGGPVASDRLAFGGWGFASTGAPDIRYGVTQEEAPGLAARPGFRLFAYVGYSGWSPGQLENEIRLGAWVVCPFEAAFADPEADDLWRRLIIRHRPDLRLAMDSPDNPGLN